MTRHHSEGCEYGSVPEAAASDWANQYELTVPLSREQTHNRHFWMARQEQKESACVEWTGGHPRRPGGRPGPRPL